MGRGRRQGERQRATLSLSDANPLSHVLPEILRPAPPLQLELLSMTKLGYDPAHDPVVGALVEARTAYFNEDEDEMVELSFRSESFRGLLGFAGEGWTAAKRELRGRGLRGAVLEVDVEQSRVIVALVPEQE